MTSTRDALAAYMTSLLWGVHPPTDSGYGIADEILAIVAPGAVDKPALLAHIRTKAEHRNLLVYAVLTGLAIAIDRGDFDVEKAPKKGANDTNGIIVEGQEETGPGSASTLNPDPKTTTPLARKEVLS